MYQKDLNRIYFILSYNLIRGDTITLDELKNYIESRNNYLTIDEYLYITNYIELLNNIKYINGENRFELVTNDNNYFNIYINNNNKTKKKN